MHTIKLLLTYYLNISVQAANLSDCRIESNRIETFLPELECSTMYCVAMSRCIAYHVHREAVKEPIFICVHLF